MEHAELVNEMAHVEHMSTQDRLHLARRRRIQQLKIWAQREKEWHKTERNSHKKYDKGHQIKSGKRGITFSDNVMLLEAASRNDVAEGLFSILLYSWVSISFYLQCTKE